MTKLTIPSKTDPRWPFFCILTSYVVLGLTVLGFNRSVGYVVMTVAATVGLDLLLHKLLRPNDPPLFPLSAAISGMGLSILVNYAHGSWLPLIPIFFTVASKYLFTFNGRHLYNPTLFGITAALYLGQGMISASPAYQWGGSMAMVAYVVTAALALFVFRIGRSWLIGGFIGFYMLELAIRAYITRHHVPPETLFLGALTSPAFYLFSFFMITDPATSPSSRRGQLLMAGSIVLIDLLLHLKLSLSTLFWAGFYWFTARGLWLHGQALWQERGKWLGRLRGWWPRPLILGGGTAVITSLAWGGLGGHDAVQADFKLVAQPVAHTGLIGRKSDVLQQLDPRIAPLAKWVLSVGDAVAVADVNNDGLPDVFLTYPLKQAEDRAALYLNKGDFRFERVALPLLDDYVRHPAQYGLPSGALWLDLDNDGDQDLLLLTGYGKLRLLLNQLTESGQLGFKDGTTQWGLDEYGVTLAANAIDWDRDGRLDIVTGSPFSPWLPGYAKPTPLTPFKLPQPEYPGDRRMFNFMHRTWHDANNGGGISFLHNRDGRLQKLDAAALGVADKRWTLAIGTGDFNNDGWPDLYLANDFGPDQLLLNRRDGHWQPIRGALVGTVGHDTYKGMNASVVDFDNNGWLDVYVSNVHERLQAEGSLLWMNRGQDVGTPAQFEDQASQRNALNERGFGWGAATGDLDRDGRIDILQTNGMVDNAYEPKPTACVDYWYWNEKIALTHPDVHGHADRWADLRGRCIFPAEARRVYLNQGRYFVDVAPQVGWADKGNSRAIALADFDNDGDLDVLVTHQFAPVSLFRNDSTAKHWLGLDLRGNGKSCNRDALGTRVWLSQEDDRQWREQVAANGFSSQNEHRLLFGLGSHNQPVTLKIDWCGQGKTEQRTLAPDQYHVLQQVAGA